MKANDMLLNNQWVNKETKEEMKTYLEINENGNTVIQKSLGHCKSCCKIYSNTGPPQGTRKISDKLSKLTPK